LSAAGVLFDSFIIGSILHRNGLLSQVYYYPKKLDISEAKKEQLIARAVMAEAKTSWHAFNLDVVRKKADDAFDMSTKVKDSLRARLYPQQQ